jgi:hypothetical protein
VKVIVCEFPDWTRDQTLRVVPISDAHVGAGACDENRLVRCVESVRSDPAARWLGLGDYCDFINRSDPRYSPSSLASWVTVADTGDLARAQRDRFLSITKPIADKCLVLVEGNHETAIARHYVRSIYSEIVTGVREAAGWPDTHKLALGYTGWLRLVFRRAKDDADRRGGTSRIDIKLHHGHGGGKLAGGKALNLERMLWTNDADLLMVGHTHISGWQQSAVEELDAHGHIRHRTRYGVHCGTFLRSTHPDGAPTYSEIAGYLPLTVGGVEVILKPGADDIHQRIRVQSAGW